MDEDLASPDAITVADEDLPHGAALLVLHRLDVAVDDKCSLSDHRAIYADRRGKPAKHADEKDGGCQSRAK